MKKKIFALILTAALSLSSFSAYAGESLSDDVTNAIVTARTKINVDDTYNDFSYETGKLYGINTYSLNWENDEDDDITIVITENGNIVSYEDNGKYSYNRDNKISELLSKADAKEYADSFIKKAIPERISELSCTKSDTDSNFAYFYYTTKVNNIPVICNDVSVTVSRKDGSIVDFSNNGVFFKDNIDKSTNFIDLETAKQNYIANAVKLRYLTNYDSKTKKTTFTPTYAISNISIDAKTGEKIFSIKYDSVFNDDLAKESTMDSVSSAASGDYQLSDSELASVEKTKGFITADKAKAVINNYKLNFDLSNCSDGELVKDYNDKDTYLWRFYSNDDNFSVNALTGELESFYTYKEDEDKTVNLNENQAKDKIYNYLKLLASDKLNEVSYEGIDYNEHSNTYSIQYLRKINGISTSKNYIYIYIDAKTGALSTFDKYWNKNIEVINKKINLSPEDAFDNYAKSSNFILCYSRIDNEEYTDSSDEKYIVAPVYTAQTTDTYYLDPETGIRLNYNGEPYEEDKKPDSYTDISGNQYEKEINLLLENGYYFSNKEFKPNENMTVGDFIELSNNKTYYFKYREVESVAKDMDLDVNAPLTRLTCGKIMVHLAGYDKLSKANNAFADLYSDISEENRAVAGLTAIILGDNNSNGEYKPEEIMTRGEGAYYIYNLICYREA